MKTFSRLLLLGLFLLMPARLALGADTNHNFAKWEKEISAYERADAANPPPKGATLFIGSSTILYWTNLAKDFPDRQVINRGFGGSEILDSTHFADRIIFPYAPRLIFLKAGGNDLWNGKSVDQVAADFRDFATTVHVRLPDTDIVFISLSSSISRWKQNGKEMAVNGLVKDFMYDKPWLHYIETYPNVLGADGKPRPELFRHDNLHFNPDGYKLLAEWVRAGWPVIPGKI